ncbi:MAG: energy transducer TonB [Bacteroidales bacterium]
MEAKKNPRVDLEKKRTLFVQIGLLVSLSFVLFAFELKQYDKPGMVLTSVAASTDLEETVIQTERQQELPPPPPQQITTVLEIVDNNQDIFDEIEINIEATKETLLQDYAPPTQKEQEQEEEIIYQVVEENASFKGGTEALFNWLGANLTYPTTARDAGIEGIVYVQFVVEKNGAITNVEIKQSSLGGGCEEAAVAAVSKMPNWNPGKQRNRPVRSIFILPVHFQLAK